MPRSRCKWGQVQTAAKKACRHEGMGEGRHGEGRGEGRKGNPHKLKNYSPHPNQNQLVSVKRIPCSERKRQHIYMREKTYTYTYIVYRENHTSVRGRSRRTAAKRKEKCMLKFATTASSERQAKVAVGREKIEKQVPNKTGGREMFHRVPKHSRGNVGGIRSCARAPA